MRDPHNKNSPNQFSMHDPVHVLPLDKRGTIVGMERAGTFKVEVEGKVIELDGRKLRVWRRERNSADGHSLGSGVTFHGRLEDYGLNSTRTIDIHGMRVEEARNFLGKVIDQAYLQRVNTITVVHGIGSGVLKRAIHEFLAELKKQDQVENYELNPHNPGETRVFF